MIFNNVSLRIKNVSLVSKTLQLAIDRNLIAEKLSNILDSKDLETIEKSDGFLKFITESRDWAFQYIEEVQTGLDKFINDIEPEIVYFDEYGVVGDAYPHYHSMKKISESYKELRKLLPDDYGKIDV